MAGEDIISEILGYLKKAGPTNTFRLASVMGMERAKLLALLKKLEGIQAIRFECGNAIFLKFISGEKPKLVDIKTSSPRPEQKVKIKPAEPKALQLLQTENTCLKMKLSGLKETVKELEKKAYAHPKTITRTVIKTIVKKVPVIKTVVKRSPVAHSSLQLKKANKIKEKTELKKKFKMPPFTFLNNLKKLKTPEFVK